MNKFFQIGNDAQQYYRNKAKDKQNFENILYLLFCIIIAAFFIYQTVMTLPQDGVSQAQAQNTYSLGGGDK